MKKITLLFLSVFSGIHCFAQDNWDTVAASGLSYQSRFYDLIPYNGKLYATADSGYMTPTLYSSSLATYGSWTRETGVTPFLQGGSEDLFSRLATDGTYLFAGSANWSGGFQTPQVYRYDGSTYKNHGTIPFSQSQNMYQDISAMAFFSASGAPDSIFAFVTSYAGMEVWKTSTSASNPGWVQALVMPGSTSIVSDAIIFNGKLYAATCGDANGSFILRTADGMTWDTVGYGGFGNANNSAVKTLAIFNGELYAGTQNSSTGAQLYKTSDGTNFTNISLTGVGIPPNYLVSVSEITAIGNRMFIVLRKDSASFRNQYVFYTSDGINFTQSTIGTGVENATLEMGFGEGRIEPYNGAVFVTCNTNSYNGRIWRLDIPDASFNPTITNACQYTPTTFTATGVGTSHEWYENGSLLGTANTYSVTNGTPGTVTIKHKSFNGQISDSLQITYTVNAPPSLSVGASPSFTVCPGQPVTVTATATGGAPPYTYSWSTFTPGFPDPTPLGTFTFAPASTGSYTVYATDANGCVSNFLTPLASISGSATDISGTITYSGGPVTNGNVYILKYQPTYSGTDTISVVPIAANGTYFKGGILYGQYLIKADPDLSIAALSNTMSTYNGGFFRWDSASPFLHTCAGNSQIDITLLELPLQNGTATISGHVVEGPGYGQRLMNPQHNPFMVPGGPLKGIDVKLGKNPGGGIQARTMTDTSATSTGYYEFTNVPPGDYRIYVDIPNLPMDSLREVTVTISTDSIPDNDYKADSVMVYVENPVSIKTNTGSLNNILVFPNPAKDNFCIEYEVVKSSEVKLSVYDIVGKEIHTETSLQQGKQKQWIRTENWPSGVYFIRLGWNGSLKTIRVVVSR